MTLATTLATWSKFKQANAWSLKEDTIGTLSVLACNLRCCWEDLLQHWCKIWKSNLKKRKDTWCYVSYFRLEHLAHVWPTCLKKLSAFLSERDHQSIMTRLLEQLQRRLLYNVCEMHLRPLGAREIETKRKRGFKTGKGYRVRRFNIHLPHACHLLQ